MTEYTQVFRTEDGKIFDSKAELNDYIRRPKIKEALTLLTDGHDKLSDWLIENQEAVQNAFDTGTIRRVTKSERKKLRKALDAIVEAGNKEFDFIITNADAMYDGFRWPTVKRMTDEEKEIAAKEAILEIEGSSEDLADWAIDNREAVLKCFEAGKQKRKVSPKATEALAEWRAAQKAAKEAAAEADSGVADAAGTAVAEEAVAEEAVAEEPAAE
ncbi:MAG: hypothetical protein OEX12_00335 [Gammaproteobacteria bacterium]|nr:hypothetical protein [Gammaproteobacteria bacterium]